MADQQQTGASAFSGRTRSRAPKKSVLVVDRIARWTITLGGIGSIAAVSLVGLFLFYVVVPLFLPSSTEPASTLPAAPDAALPVHAAVDEYGSMAWTMHNDGAIRLRLVRDGAELERLDLPDAGAVTCWSFSIEGDQCAFGYADGTVRLGAIGFETDFLGDDEVLPAWRDLEAGAIVPYRRGVVQRTPEDQFRYLHLEVALDDPVPLSDFPLVLVDQSVGNNGPLFAAIDAAGVLHVREVRKRRNLLTGQVTVRTTGESLDLRATGHLAEGSPPARKLLLTGLGDNVMIAWSDGRLLRVDTSDPSDPRLSGELDLVPEEGHRLTAAGFQIGKASLITADDLGRVRVWFRVRDPDTENHDGTTLVLAHDLPGRPAIATSLASSARTRVIAAGYADGAVALYHVTSGQRIAEARMTDQSVDLVALNPRDELMLALSGDAGAVWTVDAPHPETSWGSLMGKVWYEGYDKPEWVWQSSAATDSFEPKYSLMPLIFGTLKATLYSLLLGLPLAWLAAIYTSEFLHPRTKARIKPTIELMASLPSVVLGFLAALVFAPFMENLVPETLAALATLPFCWLLGAHLWQLLPRHVALRWSAAKFPLMFLALPAGLLLAGALGGPVERVFFAGDMVAWLDGQIGGGAGGWMILLLPLAAVAVFLLNTQVTDGWMRGLGNRSRAEIAVIDLGRFLLSAGAVLLLAWGASALLATAGLDPRGGYVDTYVQRNALVVGVVMGFAIIPIIYTISEDALSAVPDHLRAASLGAGATPWQTAVRVIVPPAVSGLFSAMMIGLGRAVGETMIVLMAAGNTPVMQWNIYNGFRTLSANIAVELPEAVQNSTHYRTLFLAALTLFAMTFVLNTVAEAVRIRFRKKSLEL